MIETDLTSEPGVEVVQLNFPAGLPGFPHLHRFELAPWGVDDSPFSTLVSVDDPGVGFVLVSPWDFHPDYEFDLDTGTAQRLGITDPGDAVVLCVVTLQDRPEDATINLLGPIVVNRHTLDSCQAVLPASGYNVRTPLARTA